MSTFGFNPQDTPSFCISQANESSLVSQACDDFISVVNGKTSRKLHFWLKDLVAACMHPDTDTEVRDRFINAIDDKFEKFKTNPDQFHLKNPEHFEMVVDFVLRFIRGELFRDVVFDLDFETICHVQYALKDHPDWMISSESFLGNGFNILIDSRIAQELDPYSSLIEYATQEQHLGSALRFENNTQRLDDITYRVIANYVITMSKRDSDISINELNRLTFLAMKYQWVSKMIATRLMETKLTSNKCELLLNLGLIYPASFVGMFLPISTFNKTTRAYVRLYPNNISFGEFISLCIKMSIEKCQYVPGTVLALLILYSKYISFSGQRKFLMFETFRTDIFPELEKLIKYLSNPPMLPFNQNCMIRNTMGALTTGYLIKEFTKATKPIQTEYVKFLEKIHRLCEMIEENCSDRDWSEDQVYVADELRTSINKFRNILA